MASVIPFTLEPVALAAAASILTKQCHGASRAAGWWHHPKTGLDFIQVLRAPADEMQALIASLLVPQKLCLSHSELSEAMEGHRKGLKDDKLPHRSMLEVELADALIRIFDLAGALDLDLPGAVSEKMAFNQVRPDHQIAARLADGGKVY